MKLRLQGNSLRLRLTRSEVVRLDGHGTVEEAASFGSGGRLTYRIQRRTGTEPLHADFSGGAITVLVPTETARVWASGDEVGPYAQDGALRIAIEKGAPGRSPMPILIRPSDFGREGSNAHNDRRQARE